MARRACCGDVGSCQREARSRVIVCGWRPSRRRMAQRAVACETRSRVIWFGCLIEQRVVTGCAIRWRARKSVSSMALEA